MLDKINRLLSESSEHVRVKTCQTRSIGYCLSLVNMLQSQNMSDKINRLLSESSEHVTESKHVRQDQ